MIGAGWGAFVVGSIVLLAPNLTQAPPAESPVEEALKAWVPCLHAEAKRVKASGVAAETAVEAAYGKCGTGDVALNNAVTALETERPFSKSDRITLIEGVRTKIRLQVMAGVTDLSPFSFRELVAGPNFDLNSPGFKKCDKNPTTIVCTELFDNVAGAPAITSYTIYNRKLAQFLMSTERSNLPAIITAFTQKYGKPCNSQIKQVQNRLGNTFESTELTWCFKTGKMVLSEIGPRITHSSAIYTDEVHGEPTSPVPVDF